MEHPPPSEGVASWIGSCDTWKTPRFDCDFQGAFAAREIDAAVAMAIMTIKSTYSLDVESVRVLEALAQRWNVSKSEVLRRAIRIAATGGEPGEGASLGTLDRLQTSLRERKVDVPQWAREQKAERRAVGCRSSPNDSFGHKLSDSGAGPGVA